jgi:RNA polymerase sigma-70 factor (ECF subfamily)
MKSTLDYRMNPTREPSQPLEAARRGDRQAFDRLVRPLMGNLLALARRLGGPQSGEDLLQEALIRAHRGLPDFRGDCTFRSWIIGILFRLGSEPRRFRGPGPLPGQVELTALIPDRLDVDPGEQVTTRDLLKRVEAAMERLPVRQRTALHLRAVEGWDYGEIAAALETSEGATRNAVMEARRRLRDRLGDEL